MRLWRSWFRRTRTPASQDPAQAAGLDAELLESLDGLARQLVLTLDAGLRSGRQRGRPAGTGYEYRDFRDYAPGDDARHILWRRYARDQQLLVAVHAGELNPRVHILLDRSRSMSAPGPGDLKDRYARTLALATAWLWMRAGAIVRLATFQGEGFEEATPGAIRGPGELFGPVSEWLLASKPDGDTRFGAVEAYAEANARLPGFVVLISDFADHPRAFSKRLGILVDDLASDGEMRTPGSWEGAEQDGLDRLVDMGHRLWTVRVIDPAEQSLPNRTRLVDAEADNQELWIALHDENRSSYARVQAEHNQLLQAFADEVEGAFALARADESPLLALTRLVEALQEVRR